MPRRHGPLTSTTAHVTEFKTAATKQKLRSTVKSPVGEVELNSRGSRLLASLLAAPEDLVATVEKLLAEPATAKSELISPDRAAAILGVSRPTVVRWGEQGKLTDHPVNTHHRYVRAEVEQLAAQRDEEATQRRAVAARARAQLAPQLLETAPSPQELIEAGVAARNGDPSKLEAVMLRQRRADARRSAQAAAAGS